MLKKIQKELSRIKKKVFRSGQKDKEIEQFKYAIENLPYEINDKISKNINDIHIPIIRTIDETLGKIISDKCSIARFGDGEFNVMNGGRISFQDRSSELARRLKDVLASNKTNLLIALVDTFGVLDHHTQPGIDFWRKWMSKKRQFVYSNIDMNKTYWNALFTRPYIIFNKSQEHYKYCKEYFHKIRNLWAGRNIVICEGAGKKFGVYNDLLSGTKSISRIICPAKSAYSRYDEILSAFNDIDHSKLVLAALGPTATILAYDLHNEGYQAIDIGHLDMEYEAFLKKEGQSHLEINHIKNNYDKNQLFHESEFMEQIIQVIS